MDAPVVVSPAWGEHVVSYPVPVYVQFVDAAGCGVEACSADRFVQWKLPAQIRARGESVGQVIVLFPRGWFHIPCRAFAGGDPGSLPVRLLQQAHLEAGRTAVGRGVVVPVPDTHLPHALRARPQRLALVLDADG